MSKLISLTQNFNALVDDADYEELMKHKWFAMRCKKHGKEIIYAARKAGQDRLFMHRVLMNAPDGHLVDHRNFDGLDCRRENLRLATYSQNGMNRRIDSRNKTGATGITLCKRSGKWKVSICVRGNKIHLGVHASFEDALKARQAAEKEHFGSFANPAASAPTEGRIITNTLIAAQIQNEPRKVDHRSKSGVTGVTFNSRTNQWQVQISDSGSRRHIGWFRDKEAAIAARKQAEDEINARKQPLQEIEL